MVDLCTGEDLFECSLEMTVLEDVIDKCELVRGVLHESLGDVFAGATEFCDEILDIASLSQEILYNEDFFNDLRGRVALCEVRLIIRGVPNADMNLLCCASCSDISSKS